jgi:hypothetical protein
MGVEEVKLCDIKDSNGTSIQSYVDTLVEKLQQSSNLTGFVIICDMESARQGENDGLHIVSTLGEGAQARQIPNILRELAHQMERSPLRYSGGKKLHEEN